jgi:hypothetical protein
MELRVGRVKNNWGIEAKRSRSDHFISWSFDLFVQNRAQHLPQCLRISHEEHLENNVCSESDDFHSCAFARPKAKSCTVIGRSWRALRETSEFAHSCLNNKAAQLAALRLPGS